MGLPLNALEFCVSSKDFSFFKRSFSLFNYLLSRLSISPVETFKVREMAVFDTNWSVIHTFSSHLSGSAVLDRVDK